MDSSDVDNLVARAQRLLNTLRRAMEGDRSLAETEPPPTLPWSIDEARAKAARARRQAQEIRRRRPGSARVVDGAGAGNSTMAAGVPKAVALGP